jgi:hypothetical protein
MEEEMRGLPSSLLWLELDQHSPWKGHIHRYFSGLQYGNRHGTGRVTARFLGSKKNGVPGYRGKKIFHAHHFQKAG